MPSELDMQWRLPTSEGLTWRLATMDDLPELHRLWDEMDRKLGPQDRPDLMRMPVVLSLVAEDAEGRIVAGLYGEAVIDWTMIGAHRGAARTIKDVYPHLFLHLFERSIRVSRVLVPLRLRRHMARMLPDFVDITEKFAQFSCTLRR